MAKKEKEYLQLEELMEVFQEEKTPNIKTPEEQEGKPKRTIPPLATIPRVVTYETPKIQRSLFEELDEVVHSAKDVVISTNIRQLITPDIFNGSMWGLKVLLFKQSYLHHNDDILSGTHRTLPRAVEDDGGNPIFTGTYAIMHGVYLNDICEAGFGQYNAIQRVQTDKAIDILDKNKIHIRYGNGAESDVYLVKVLRRDYDPKTKALYYDLVLNPIFTDLSKGFGKILENTMLVLSDFLKKKGKKKDTIYYRFFELLAVQEKSIYKVSTSGLIEYLGLTKEYKNNPKRVIGKLEVLFEAAVETSYLMEIPNPIIPIDGYYYFKINPELKNPRKKLPKKQPKKGE